VVQVEVLRPLVSLAPFRGLGDRRLRQSQANGKLGRGDPQFGDASMTNQGLYRGKCIGSAFLSEVGGGHAEGLTDPNPSASLFRSVNSSLEFLRWARRNPQGRAGAKPRINIFQPCPSQPIGHDEPFDPPK